MPRPVRSPNPTTIGTLFSREPKLATMSPRPQSAPPMVATILGPNRSCALPAKTIEMAKTPTPMAYGRLAFPADQPQPPSATGLESVLAITLQEYRTPSARLIPSPAKTTIQPRDAGTRVIGVLHDPTGAPSRASRSSQYCTRGPLLTRRRDDRAPRMGTNYWGPVSQAALFLGALTEREGDRRWQSQKAWSCTRQRTAASKTRRWTSRASRCSRPRSSSATTK